MLKGKKQALPYEKPEILCLRLLSEQAVMSTSSEIPGSTNESLDDEIKFNW
jgi:hypothetical protein